MLGIIIYILTFVIIAFVLMSAVVIHLLLGLHMRSELEHRPEKSDEKDHKRLHEIIFNSPQ